MGGGGVPELVQPPAGVLVKENAGAVVSEPGPTGVRADVPWLELAGGGWFAVGEEQRSAGTTGSV